MNSTAREIEERLRNALEITHLDVVDDSALHAGHLGAQGGDGHFRLLVVSNAFEDLSRIAAHRSVYEALGDLMQVRIHALELRTLTPKQWQELPDER